MNSIDRGPVDLSGRLRVVLVAPPYFDIPPRGYGGVETVVADLVDALVDRGHDVTVLGAGRAATAARFVPLWEHPVAERLGEPYPEVMHAIRVRRAVQKLAADGPIDVVHDHTLAGPLNAAVYQALGVPTVVTVHGPLDDDLYPYYRELGDDVTLVAISDRQRQLAPDLPWGGRVHNALSLDGWRFEARPGDYALFFGRFASYKGPHLALEAAHRAGIPLVLAGKCDEPAERKYFEQQVVPLLGEHDSLMGQADSAGKRELLARARCLLFPIQWEEPFGMVMIEAMACGTPVVGLRGGAVPEVVVDGVTGYVCDNPAQLPAAIAAVSALDRADCRRHVETHFGVEALGRGYERVYRDVVEHARRRGPSSLRSCRHTA